MRKIILIVLSIIIITITTVYLNLETTKVKRVFRETINIYNVIESNSTDNFFIKLETSSEGLSNTIIYQQYDRNEYIVFDSSRGYIYFNNGMLYSAPTLDFSAVTGVSYNTNEQYDYHPIFSDDFKVITTLTANNFTFKNDSCNESTAVVEHLNYTISNCTGIIKVDLAIGNVLYSYNYSIKDEYIVHSEIIL